MDLRSPEGLTALLGCPSVGPVAAVRRAREADLGGIDSEVLRVAYDAAGSTVAAAQAAGVQTVTVFDDAYPSRLAAVAGAPPVLWYRGDLRVASGRLLAVVGTRRPTRFGVSAAQAAVQAAAAAGVGLVSGLAFGVDAAAHEAAVGCGCANVIVLAGGVSAGEIHPSEHGPLAERILTTGGLIVSEHPPGTETHPHRLIARNRIQSGLAVAVLIAQTGVAGGTPFTARYALEQQRPLWAAVPRDAHPSSDGNRRLLDTPGIELGEVMPAFAKAAAARRFGDRPVAQPLDRDGLPAFAASLATAATPASPDTLF